MRRNDDFWKTYIAATPEENADFRRIGWLVVSICAGFMVAGSLVRWLH